jgi:hypothetical protein
MIRQLYKQESVELVCNTTRIIILGGFCQRLFRSTQDNARYKPLKRTPSTIKPESFHHSQPTYTTDGKLHVYSSGEGMGSTHTSCAGGFQEVAAMMASVVPRSYRPRFAARKPSKEDGLPLSDSNV